MKAFCWVITIISCIIAGMVLLATFTSSNGAPQEAAGAAMAAAIAVIPYVFSRAVTELSESKAEEQNAAIIALLKKQGSSSIEDKARKYDSLSNE